MFKNRFFLIIKFLKILIKTSFLKMLFLFIVVTSQLTLLSIFFQSNKSINNWMKLNNASNSYSVIINYDPVVYNSPLSIYRVYNYENPIKNADIQKNIYIPSDDVYSDKEGFFLKRNIKNSFKDKNWNIENLIDLHASFFSPINKLCKECIYKFAPLGYKNLGFFDAISMMFNINGDLLASPEPFLLWKPMKLDFFVFLLKLLLDEKKFNNNDALATYDLFFTIFSVIYKQLISDDEYIEKLEEEYKKQINNSRNKKYELIIELIFELEKGKAPLILSYKLDQIKNELLSGKKDINQINFLDVNFGLIPYSKKRDLLTTNLSLKFNESDKRIVNLFGIPEEDFFENKNLFIKNNDQFQYLYKKNKSQNLIPIIINKTLAKKKDLKINDVIDKFFYKKDKLSFLKDNEVPNISSWFLNLKKEKSFEKYPFFKNNSVFLKKNNQEKYFYDLESNDGNDFKEFLDDAKIISEFVTEKDKKFKIIYIEENYGNERIFIDKVEADKLLEYDQLFDWYYEKYSDWVIKNEDNYFKTQANLLFDKALGIFPVFGKYNNKEENKKNFKRFFPVFNGKFLSFKHDIDQYIIPDISQSISIHSKTGNYFSNVLPKNGSPTILNIEDFYLLEKGIKKINRYIKSVFYPLFLITSIIIYFIISNIAISLIKDENKKKLLLFKFLGYGSFLIFSLNLFIYLPILIFSFGFSTLITAFTLKLFQKVILSSLNIYLPVYLNFSLLLIIIIVSFFIFLIIYFFHNLFILKKIKINQINY
jgi:hypothetical protein